MGVMVPGVPSSAFENLGLEMRRYCVHPDYLSIFSNDEMLCFAKEVLERIMPFSLIIYCLAEISNIVYRFYNNPKMKSNLISKQKCAAQPLAHRKERKTWENTLKCSTISLFLP